VDAVGGRSAARRTARSDRPLRVEVGGGSSVCALLPPRACPRRWRELETVDRLDTLPAGRVAAMVRAIRGRHLTGAAPTTRRDLADRVADQRGDLSPVTFSAPWAAGRGSTRPPQDQRTPRPPQSCHTGRCLSWSRRSVILNASQITGALPCLAGFVLDYSEFGALCWRTSERGVGMPLGRKVMDMRRVVVIAVLGLAIWGSPAAAGHVAAWGPQQSVAADDSLRADFNNDGFADLAVGVPREDAGRVVNAGVVNVQYGSAGGLAAGHGQIFTQVAGLPEPGDFFGGAVAAGDFNHDGFADLAVGASGEDVGPVQDAGAVSVLYGSATGLTTTGSRLFTQVGSAPEPGDSFGFALATGDFNHDGFADLAAGAPYESTYDEPFVGTVSVLYGSAGGLSTIGGRIFRQVGSAPEPGDLFGFALATGDFDHDGFAELAVGAPYEDAGNVRDAGAVSVLYGSAGGLTANPGQIFTQVAGLPEPGDLFGLALTAGDFGQRPPGDGFADLAVGAPFEDVGGVADAGAVSWILGSTGGLTTLRGRIFTQVAGLPEPGDVFGFALATGESSDGVFSYLAIGTPFEDVGNVRDAGAVSALYYQYYPRGDDYRLLGRIFTQLGSAPERGDVFGYALTTGDFNHDGGTDLVAGAPEEDVGAVVDAGAVSVLNGLTRAGGQFLTQDSPGVGSSAEPGDFFGAALAAANPAPVSTAATTTTTTNATAVAPPTPGSSVLWRH